MTKRILSLFLACILAIPIAIPAYADQLTPYIDLKSQGYLTVNGTIDTDFVFYTGKNAEFSFPVQFTGRSGMVEFILESPRQFAITHKETGTALTCTSLGDNLYLYRGSVGTSVSEVFTAYYDGSYRISLQRARYYPDFVNASSVGFDATIESYGPTISYTSNTGTVKFSRDPAVLGEVMMIRNESFTVMALYTPLHIVLQFQAEQLMGYDRLALDFTAGDWAVENITAQYSNNPVDVSFSGIVIDNGNFDTWAYEYTFGKNRYCLDIDLTGIKLTEGEVLEVYIDGRMCVQDKTNASQDDLPQEFVFQIHRTEKLLFAQQEDGQASLLVKIWQGIENLTASLLRVFEDNEEITDDFRDEQAKDETQVDEYIDIIETAPTVDLEGVDDFISDLEDEDLDTGFTDVLGGMLDGYMGTYLVMFPVIFAVIGYVLYGKR